MPLGFFEHSRGPITCLLHSRKAQLDKQNRSTGAGKTLLARALPGILPDISIEESLDVTRIYSVADQLPAGTPLFRHGPFRAPHHTISHADLVGAGIFRSQVKFH